MPALITSDWCPDIATTKEGIKISKKENKAKKLTLYLSIELNKIFFKLIDLDKTQLRIIGTNRSIRAMFAIGMLSKPAENLQEKGKVDIIWRRSAYKRETKSKCNCVLG